MSINLSRISLFAIVAVGFMFGYLVQKNSPDREPASQTLARPRLAKPWAHSLVGKNNRLFDLTIAPVGGIADQDDQEVRLRALVTLLGPIEGDLEYTWILPNGVSVVEGEVNDSWANILPGQTATTEISVVGFSKASAAKTLVLRVSALSAGTRLAGSVTFASSDFQRLESQANSISAEMASGADANESKYIKKSRSALDKLQR